MKTRSLVSKSLLGAGALVAFCLACLPAAHADWSLVIVGSPRNCDTPSPLGYGTNGSLAANSWITNTVDRSVSTDGTNWGCKGWTLKKTSGGAAVTNGPGVQAIFQITTNLTLTWSWTNFWLSIVGSAANYGVPGPLGYGTHRDIADGTWVTNGVATPADEAAGTRHACLGWDLRYATGTPIAHDGSTQAVFQMQADSLVLRWNWTNEYYLSVTANSNGTASTSVPGWYTNGLETQAEATPDPGAVFLQWTGDVPAGGQTNNPLSLTMDQPRTIQAQFSTNPSSELKQWTGVGNWTSRTNWSPAGMPGPEDDVLIKSGSVTLSDPVRVASLAITNATLTFFRWTTQLTASSNVTIRKGGVVTCVGGFLNEGMSNRVAIACSNLTIQAGGAINVAGCGYKGGYGNTEAAQGPGASGSYGGRSVGPTYGTPEAADLPGSGGMGRIAGNSFAGGNGGGAAWVQATGTVRVDGIITANGNATANGSGGSGGGIHIECQVFEGTGTVTAIGATGGGYSYGGGGGRVAVLFDPVAQAARPKPAVAFSLRGSSGPYGAGDIGTLYFPTMDALNPAWMPHSGQLIAGTWAEWRVDGISILNGWLRLPADGARFRVTNTFSVAGASARLELTDAALQCGSLVLDAGRMDWLPGAASGTVLSCTNSCLLTNGASLHFYASATNAMTPSYGALLSVSNDMFIASNSWLYPYSNPTNGGSLLIRVSGLAVAAGGGIDADGKGYAGGAVRGPGFGPGRGSNTYSGAGYGGVGGRSGGRTYGSASAPVDCGSGAYLYAAFGSLSTGRGGGAIRIEADETVTIDGELTANGNSGYATSGDGGGSGGGIYVTARRFAGTKGSLTANGGNGSTDVTRPGGAGGGGRIAVWSAHLAFSGTASVTNGTGAAPAAAVGTIMWGYRPGQSLILLIR